MCSEQDPLSLFKGLRMGIFGFSQRETGAKSVAMVPNGRCHSVPFVMYISGVKLKNTAPIFLEILMIQCFTFQVIYDVITSLICIIQKRKYL